MFVGHGDRHNVFMILSYYDSVFFPDHAAGVAGDDRIIRRLFLSRCRAVISPRCLFHDSVRP